MLFQTVEKGNDKAHGSVYKIAKWLAQVRQTMWMLQGLGKNVFPRFESLVKRLSMLYFRTFKQQTVEYFNTAISVFWNSPVTAPALFFFCENDTLCDPESMEEMIAYWQSRGITVEKRRWKESIHAAHLRAHPQEYLSILDSFLQSLNMVPLKAKM